MTTNRPNPRHVSAHRVSQVSERREVPQRVSDDREYEDQPRRSFREKFEVTMHFLMYVAMVVLLIKFIYVMYHLYGLTHS